MLEGAVSMIIYRSAKPAAYVYICTHIKTRQFYIGYREKNVRLNRTSDIDLPLYRTSSNYVNPIFDEFEWQIVAEFFNGEYAYDFEQVLIKENWGNPLLINKQFHAKEDTKFRLVGGHSEETKQKIRISNTGRPLSEESKQKLSLKMRGRKLPPRSNEWKENISKGKTGTTRPPVSEETSKKLSLANKGRKLGPPSEDTRQKMREAKLGTKRAPFSVEHRQKISKALIDRNRIKKELEDNQH